MYIRKKVLLITLLIFIVLSIVFTFAHKTLLSGYSDIEKQNTIKNVERVKDEIKLHNTYLEEIARDWANRKNTYDLLRTQNPDYISSDLQAETLSGLNLNLILFYNDSGALVYAKALDLKTKESEPVPPQLLNRIRESSLLARKSTDSINGLILLEENPLFIAGRPIVNNSEGPVQGTLIVGRYLDNDSLRELEEISYSSLLAYRVDREMPPDFQESFSKAKTGIAFYPLSPETVAGYFVINEVSGQPALLVRTDFSRDLYSQGKRNLDSMYLFLLLTGVIVGTGVNLLLDRLFVSRLIKVDDFIAKIRTEKDFSKKLEIEGSDELYWLSREINALLSEMNLIEHELKTEEHEKKVILDSLNELLLFVDRDLRLIWANKAALSAMNMELKDAVGYCQKEVPWTSGHIVKELELEKIIESGETKQGEFKDLKGKVWYFQAIPVTDEKGQIIGILETGLEITERKKAEELLQEKLVAEAANRTKSEFLANMSHELRTPLNSIIGFSDILLEKVFGDLNERQFKYVNNISRSGKHLLRIINDILDLSKIEAGKMELHYETFSVLQTLADVKNLLSPLASAKKMQVEIKVENDLTIYADKDRILQVLYNLLSNAIKFSHANGYVIITAKRKGVLAEITVTDEGIGISEEDQKKLFKPFCQLDSFASKAYEGTGLGLSLVKKITNLHDGYVWFRSDLGKGSTFAFTVPINGKEIQNK